MNPEWDQETPEDQHGDDDGQNRAPTPLLSRLGVQAFGLDNKTMVGLTMGLGTGLWRADLEFSPLWLDHTSEEIGGSFLGNQWGAYLTLAPIRTRYLRVMGSVGTDVYHLWGIHKDKVEGALSLKSQADFRPTRRASLFVAARAYPLSTSGLELGTAVDGSTSTPILASTGVEWRFQ